MGVIGTSWTSFWNIPLSVTLLSLVIILVIHILVRKVWYNRKYKLPPGPQTWPIVGDLPDIAKTTPWEYCKHLQGTYGDIVLFRLDIAKTTPWEYCKHLQGTYGDIVLFRLGMVPTVLISGLKNFTEALVTKGNDFAGRQAVTSWDPLVCGGNDIIMSRRLTPQWVAQRKLFHSLMRNFVGGKTLQIYIDNGLRRFHKKIEATHECHHTGKAIHKMVLNTMLSVVYERDFEYEDPLFLKLEENFNRVSKASLPGIMESMFPFMQHSPYLPGRSILKECGDFREKLIRDMIDSKLKDNSWENGRNLIDEIISIMKQTKENKSGYRLQIHDMIAVVIDFELGSTDTTGFTLIWALLFILKNPAVQKRIHMELDNVLGDAELCFEDFDKENLPYVTAVFRESLRLQLVTPFYLPHVTTCDTTLGAYEIPEGTNILFNVDSIHLDKNAWDDPEVFRPERFLDEFGQLLPKPDHFVPFSSGRRVCAGEVMGKKMVPYLLACIMQRYKIEPGPGEILDTTAVIIGSGRESKPYKTFFEKRI